MKNIIRKLPLWLWCLIGSIVLFLIACLVMVVGAELLGLDFNNAPRLADKLFVALWAILLTASMLLFAAMVVFVVKGFTARAGNGYTPPQTVSGSTSSRRKRAAAAELYDSAVEMQLGTDTAPMTWLRVGVLMVFFCPVGVFLAIRKTVEEKAFYYENGSRLIVFGVAAMILSAPLFRVFFGADAFDSMLLAFALPFLLGLLMLSFGLLIRHKGRVNNDYMTILKIDRITDLDRIAQLMKTDYTHAAAAVQNLINSDLLKNAYVYHRDREVIIPGISEKIALKCGRCGATTVLYQTEKHECVYCGAEI